jgi:hypothetical protein
MNKARQQLAVLFNHGICQISKKLVPNADKGKRKCDSAQPKCGSCSYSSLECVYTAQAYMDRNEVNLSSDSLMKNITDTKCTRFKLGGRRDQGILKNKAVHSGGLWIGDLASGSYHLGQPRHVPSGIVSSIRQSWPGRNGGPVIDSA